MATDVTTPPLVIIGIDAGDPGFIQRWAQEGYLPTIASIMQRGCWGYTGGPELLSEHGVWVSLFSGLSRSQHGYYFYRQLQPGTYNIANVTGSNFDAPPFWSSLSGQGKKVAVIDVPDLPVLPGLPGIQVANWAVHDSWDPEAFPTRTEPAELLGDIQQRFGAKLSMLETHHSSLAEDRRIYHELLRHVEKKGALCRHLLAQDSFDLSVIVLAEAHAANHQFWPYRQEARGHAVRGDDELTQAVCHIYQAIDREIGLVLAQLPTEANVCIVSSVGMEDEYPAIGLIEDFCRQLGYQTPASGTASRPIDIVRRLVPQSWRAAVSRRLCSRAQRERLLADQFRHGTDWHKTTAFALPTTYTSFIRVNLRGREPQGTVALGAEYEALLDRLVDDLKQLVDPQTDQPAVVRVAKTIEVFGCNPHPFLPDLFIEWQPGHFMSSVVHPRATLTQEKPEFYRPSDHCSQGFVAAAGPAIQPRGLLGEVNVLDLAPTFLELLHQPIPSQLTGKTIEAMTDCSERRVN